MGTDDQPPCVGEMVEVAKTISLDYFEEARVVAYHEGRAGLEIEVAFADGTLKRLAWSPKAVRRVGPPAN